MAALRATLSESESPSVTSHTNTSSESDSGGEGGSSSMRSGRGFEQRQRPSWKDVENELAVLSFDDLGWTGQSSSESTSSSVQSQELSKGSSASAEVITGLGPPFHTMVQTVGNAALEIVPELEVLQEPRRYCYDQELHASGRCKACNFIATKGCCKHGDACHHCHLDHPEGRKKRPCKAKREKAKAALNAVRSIEETRNLITNDSIAGNYMREIIEARFYESERNPSAIDVVVYARGIVEGGSEQSRSVAAAQAVMPPGVQYQ